MAIKFLSVPKINDSYALPSSDGSANQTMVTDGNGVMSFADVPTGPTGPAGSDGAMFTPKVFALNSPQTVSAQGFIPTISSTTVLSGTTPVVLNSEDPRSFTVTSAGIYQIVYTAYLKTTHSVRQVMAGYITVDDVAVDGSMMANYLRVTGTNQGGESTITCTCYASITTSDVVRFALVRADVNTNPTGITIEERFSIKNTISFMKIGDPV